MRNTILIAILVAFSTSSLMSQPTLIAGNSNPYITLQYTMIGINYITPPNPQGFYSWDFSSVVPIDTFNTRYYGHGGVPGDNAYTLSNIAAKSNNSYVFYHVSEVGQKIVGYRDSIDHIYSEGADYLKYPFTYLSNFIDTYTCTYILNTDTILRQGNVSVSAKSYGNLKLPYATINNVLGIQRFEAFNDFKNGVNEYYEIESYTWHVPGVALPILSFRSEYFKGTKTESGYFISKESLGIQNSSVLPFDITLLDHDGSKIPDIQFVLPYQMTLKIKCVNSIGKEMFVQESRNLPAGQNEVVFSNQLTIPGVYLMIIELDEYQFIKKFVIAD